MVAMLARHGITDEPPAEFRDEVLGLCERLRAADEATRLAAARRLREFTAMAGRRVGLAAGALRAAAHDPSPGGWGPVAAGLDGGAPGPGAGTHLFVGGG